MTAIQKLVTIPAAAVATALFSLTVLPQSGELSYEAKTSTAITAPAVDKTNNNGWD
ncbi:hypothetical protein ABT354_37705 [Streptomyces sp. NPDC000594]|uniref:hypothetical protein n=1 Tax=Streptomyces sp. NPDC000594 TaxID=3154261 RepID=UPI003333B6AA